MSIKNIVKVLRPPLAVLAFLSILSLLSGSALAAGSGHPKQQVPWADPGTVFGVEMTPLDDSGGLQQMLNTSTGWARGVVVDWSAVESIQGDYQWDQLAGEAAELNNALAAGLEPVVVVRGVPDWARLVPSQACGPINPANYDEFGNFIAQLITSYPAPNPFASVQYWSIWNEPDIDPEDLISTTDSIIGCWGDKNNDWYGGEAYGNMLNAVYPRLKAANAQAFLIAGELLLDCDPNNPACDVPIEEAPPSMFLDGILRVSTAFDGLSFHAYDSYLGAFGHYENANWDSSWDTTGPVLIAKARFVQDKLAQYNVTGKFVMNTEFALLSDGSSTPALENTKASYNAQAYASAIGSNLEANIWFDATGTWGRNNGLLERDTLTPLPAYDAYQFASEKLDGARLLAPLARFGPGVMGYAFDNAACANPGGVDCNVWVLWSLQDTGSEITLPASPERVEDVFGASLPGITQTLTLQTSPYYLEVDAQVPGINSIALNPNPVFFSQPLSLTATVSDVSAGSSPVESAQYSLDNGQTWLALLPLDGSFDSPTEAVSATLAAPDNQGSYDYDICLRGSDVWGNTATTCTTIPLVVLDNASPISSAKNPGPVAYSQPVVISATISDTLTGGSIIQSAEYSLAGGAWSPMQAQDGFNAVTETVTATLAAPATVGDYPLCVRGSDASQNTSAEDCTILSVFSPNGPQAAGLLADPNPARTNQVLTIFATIDDSLTGGAPVASAEYSFDGGASWLPMLAQDGIFDEVVEPVRAAAHAPAEPGLYTLCVRGEDNGGNLGAPTCVELPVSLYTVSLSMLNRNWLPSSLPANGDYESGLEDWTAYTTYMPITHVTENPLNPIEGVPDRAIPVGTGSALLGNAEAGCRSDFPFGPDVFGGLEQRLTLPDGNLSLKFKYIIYTQDLGVGESGAFYDTFEVYVNGTRLFVDGNDVNELNCNWHRVPSAENPRSGITSGWAEATLDLSPFAGQTVTIAFRNYSRYDGWFNTYIFLDDVIITQSD